TALVSQYRGPVSPARYSARRSRSRAAPRLLEAIVTILGDAGGQRGVEYRHPAPEGREVRHTLASWAIGRHQLRHGPSSLRDHDLAPLAHLVEESREVLAGFANASGAHEAIVLHVAHGVNGNTMGRSIRCSRNGWLQLSMGRIRKHLTGA